jgi:hypothetical protein
MALNFIENTAVINGASVVEDALPLLEFLRTRDGATLDLGLCTHLHTAVLQVILAARPILAAPPAEAFLARWLLPALERRNSAATSP